MTQLIVTLRNFANAPKKDRNIRVRQVTLQHSVGVAYLRHYSNIDGLLKRCTARAVLVRPETSVTECGGKVIPLWWKQISSSEYSSKSSTNGWYEFLHSVLQRYLHPSSETIIEFVENSTVMH
jgi:hypothetical protein